MHKGPITCVVVSKDGRTIYTGGYDKRIYSWDRTTEKPELVWEHDHLVNCLALSENGKMLACGSSDHTITLYDTETNRMIARLYGHSDDVECLSFAKNDSVLVSGSRKIDNRILIWDIKTGKIMNQFKGHHDGCVNTLWIFGNTVFSAADDGNVFVWDLNDCKIIHNLAPFHCDLDACDGSKEKGLFALGMDDGSVIMYDASSIKEVKKVHAHERGVKCLAFSPSGEYFLTAGYDHQIKIWKTEDYSLVKTLPPYQYQWERSVTWTPDEKYIVGGSFGNKYCIWSVENTRFIGDDSERATPSLNDLAISKSGQIATASDDGKFRINGKQCGQANLVLTNAVGISSDGTYALWGDHSSKVHLFNVAKEKIEFSLDTQGPVNVIQYSDEHSAFYVGTYGGYIQKFKVDKPEWLNSWKVHNGAIKGLDIGNGVLVSGASDGTVHVLNMDTSEIYEIVGTTAIVDDVALTKSKEQVAVVGRDLMVRLFDLKTGKIISQHTLHRYSLKSVTVTDDDIVFAGDYWGYISIWDPTSQQVPQFIKVASNGISALQAYGESVYATSYDGGVYRVNKDGTFEEVLRLFDQSQTYEVV